MLSIDVRFGAVRPDAATAANLTRLLCPPAAPSRLTRRPGADGVALTRTAEVVLCDTAHGNLVAVLEELCVVDATLAEEGTRLGVDVSPLA